MKSLENVSQEIELIKEEGDIVFIKFDGEREKQKITVVLSYLGNEKTKVNVFL